MRRSTAAAVGTVTGAVLILGVRLSVSGTLAAPPPAFDEVGAAENPRPTPTAASRNKDRAGTPSAKPTTSKAAERQQDDEDDRQQQQEQAPASGLRDGRFSGRPVSNPFGNVQVAITVSGGEVTNVAASYPTSGQSASINAGAIPKLKAAVLEAQSADIDAVSGATFTTEAYTSSLQAAFDAARA
jgi:uncharacterized protein with FMN-binding domain